MLYYWALATGLWRGSRLNIIYTVRRVVQVEHITVPDSIGGLLRSAC
jgi:hypothetical protein